MTSIKSWVKFTDVSSSLNCLFKGVHPSVKVLWSQKSRFDLALQYEQKSLVYEGREVN